MVSINIVLIKTRKATHADDKFVLNVNGRFLFDGHLTQINTEKHTSKAQINTYLKHRQTPVDISKHR